MKLFSFDPAAYREQYRTRQWIHVERGIDPDFLEHLRDFASRQFGAHRVEGKAIDGRKDQALFEFPPEVDFPGELFDVVAEVAGLRREAMTLSERHVKAYDPDAPSEPTAHKDRFASQVSVGLSIDIPADSRLVLYPFGHREPNPFNVSAALSASLAPEQVPEVALRDAREVEVDDQPGDLVMFAGSAMWHLRRRPARAINLYLKLNDFGSDPLGEDPQTPARREVTLRVLADVGSLERCVPALSRRLDLVSRDYLRQGWHQVVRAHVWERPPVTLDESDFALLRAVDGRRNVGALASELRSPAATDGCPEGRVRRLAEQGVLDLHEPGS